MRTGLVGLCAVGLAGLYSNQVEGALLKSAGSLTTTKTVKTTTSGQKQIFVTLDPINIVQFQLDVQYDADKVQLVSVEGINGYHVTSYVNTPFIDGTFEGLVGNISGFFDGVIVPSGLATDFVQLIFEDLAPDRDKAFRTFFSDDDDFLNGFDADTGAPLELTGSQLFDAQSFAIVAAGAEDAPGFPAGVPLPGALAMGLAGGAGVLVRVARRRRRGA